MYDIELAEAFRLILNVRHPTALNWPEDITYDWFREPPPERTPEDVQAAFAAMTAFCDAIHLLEIQLYTREKTFEPWRQIPHGDQQAGEPDVFGGRLRLLGQSVPVVGAIEDVQRFLGFPLPADQSTPAVTRNPAPVLPKPQRKRGPQPGTSGYADKDRKHFPAMKRLVKRGKTITAAAKELAPKLQGGGTEPSKAARLANLFRKECGETN